MFLSSGQKNLPSGVEWAHFEGYLHLTFTFILGQNLREISIYFGGKVKLEFKVDSLVR